jgi:hypothetical protein
LKQTVGGKPGLLCSCESVVHQARVHKDDFGLSVLDLVRYLWYGIDRIDTTEDSLGANYTQVRYRNEEVVRGENEHDLAGFHAELVEAYAELLHFM